MSSTPPDARPRPPAPAPSVRAERGWWALVAVVGVASLGLQLWLPLTSGEPAHGTRLVRLVSFFTISTNVLVALLAVLVATGRHPADRHGTAPVWWRALRLGAPVCIAVVGVVYHLLLADLVELTPLGAVADAGLHTVVPVLALVGWAWFTPRGLADARAALLALVYPVLWAVWTFARGAGDGWYPYPFVDVGVVGVDGAVRGVVGVTVLLAVLLTAAVLVDRAVGRRRRAG